MTFEKEFPSLKRCQYTGEEIKVANNTICDVIFYPQLIIKNSCIDNLRVKEAIDKLELNIINNIEINNNDKKLEEIQIRGLRCWITRKFDITKDELGLK